MSRFYKPNNSTFLYLNSSSNCIKSNSITITKTGNGTGYTGTPTVVITPAAGDMGSGASATIAAPVSGALSGALTMTNTGRGYNTLPTISLSGGGNPGTNNIAGFGASVQNTTFSWDVPVERVMSLGLAPSEASTFPNPPGTASITAQGMDMPYNITGIVVGGYKFSLGTQARVSSREHNLAVGDVGATYNITMDATADSCICSNAD